MHYTEFWQYNWKIYNEIYIEGREGKKICEAVVCHIALHSTAIPLKPDQYTIYGSAFNS